MGIGRTTDGTARGTRRRRGLHLLAALATAAAVVCGSVSTGHAAGPSWIPMGTGLYDTVNDVSGTAYASLQLRGSTYVGGQFDDAGGVTVNNVARWDGSAFHTLGDPSTDGPTDVVWSMATDGSLLYVGGPFGVMSWDPDNEIWDDLAAPAGMEVYSLAWYADGTDAFLVAGGDMQPGSTCALQRYDGTAWSNIGSLTRVGSPCTVDALAQMDTLLVVGGEFDHDGSTALASMAFYDGQTDTLSPVNGDTGNGVHDYAGGGDEVGSVYALAVDDATNTIYVGGTFDDASGTSTTNLAAWNSDSFTEIGGANTQFDVNNDEVDTLAFAPGGLFVGGWFSLDNTPVNVAGLQLTSDTWIPFLGGTDDAVFTVTFDETLGQIYVGGMFGTAYSDPTPTPVANTGGIALLGTVTVAPHITAISVTGTPTVGNTLTAHVTTTGDPAPTVTMQWLRCNAWVGLNAPTLDALPHPDMFLPPGCVVITGATHDTYTLVAADQGKHIGFYAIALNDAGSVLDMNVQQSPVAAAATPTPTTTTTTPTPSLPATGGQTSLPQTALVLVLVGTVLLVPARRRWLR